MIKSAVSAKDLRHSYGTKTALAGVSLEIPKGSIFALLGPNGSGKSTLFRILSTALLPTLGDAWIDGISLRENPYEVRKKLGVVFQSPGLDGKLTVRENLVHQGYLYGLGGAALRSRCDLLLSHLGLTDRAGEMVSTLSGGLKRRAELAKGLLHQPSVVLLDEPSTGLDPGARLDLWRYLTTLRESEGLTILVTTHLMEEAEYCDKIAIINEGKMIRTGTPRELKADVGGDVLAVKSREPEALRAQIQEKLGTPSRLVEGQLLIEHKEASKFITKLIETFPGLIEAVTFRRPTLEDVFIHHTGHEFWSPVPEVKKAGKHG